jgi:hypothetical protein
MKDTIVLSVKVRPETRERLNELARMTFRGMGATIDWIVAEHYKVVKVSTLPHPTDAELVPLLTVAPEKVQP